MIVRNISKSIKTIGKLTLATVSLLAGVMTGHHRGGGGSSENEDVEELHFDWWFLEKAKAEIVQ